PMFARHALLGSVNVFPESDGLVRTVRTRHPWGDGDLPLMAALLAENDASASAIDVPLDYAIYPGSIPVISFADILTGRFDPEQIAGRRIIVGATAIELGDIVPVPVWRSIPGVTVQAIAYQSLRAGHLLTRASPLAVIAGAFLLACLLAPLSARWPWQRSLALFAGLVVVATGGAIALHAFGAILLDITPWLLTGLFSFVLGLVGRIDQQGLWLLIQGRDLRRKDAFMRLVAENTFDGLITADRNDRIQFFNRAAEKIFGYEAADIMGQDATLLLADGAAFKKVRGSKNTDAAGDTADSSFLAARGTAVETLGRRKDGETFALELAVSRMHYDDEDSMIVLVRDISARKYAEAQATKAQAQLQTAVASIPEGFVLFDAEDRFVLCNAKYREIFASVEELLVPGWRFEDIMRAYVTLGGLPEAESDAEAWIAERLAHRQSAGAAFEERHADGRWLRVGERRTGDGGTVSILADVTEQKAREEELRGAKEEAVLASRSKTEFLANMSHELRTPLNAIIGFSDILVQEMFGPIGVEQYKDYAADIHGSGQHLLDVINDILDISRLETGNMILEEDVIDLRLLVKSCVRLIEERAQAANVTINISAPETLPNMRADERKVKQALINLLSNGVKFTPEGGRVAVRAAVAADGGITLTVADTGIGIAKADMDKVLAPFGQADSVLERKYEGTGLGLPIVRSLVELHGGDFRIESQPERGTVVTLRFPPERSIGGDDGKVVALSAHARRAS
ncbi:MAG: ATP-binding protein, partial [Alphaproteobacteria bacterium]